MLISAVAHRVMAFVPLTAALLVLFAPVPMAAATTDASTGLLSVDELPGFLLDDDLDLDAVSLFKGESLYFRFVADRTIEASHVRRFAAFDGSASVAVRVTTFLSHRFAAALHRDTGPRLAFLPAGATGGVDRSSPGWEADWAELAKGRMRAEIVVRVRGGQENRAQARRRADDLMARLSRTQYAKLGWLPDVPEADRVSTRPIQIALVLVLFVLVLAPQGLLAATAFARDPAARRRMRMRMRMRMRPPPALAVTEAAECVDVSPDARRRLRRYRFRTMARTLVALAVVAATIRLILPAQMLVLAGLALVAAVGQAVWASLRRSSNSEPLWGASAVALGLLGAAFTLALAVAGGVLLFLYAFQYFFGTLPTDAARSFGTLLLVLGMLLVGLSALPYRLTRRLWLRDAAKRLDRDGRRPVLFLRSWVADYLQMRAHRTGRHLLLERLSFRRWDRFEEIVVAELWKQGPVVGLAEPGTRLPPVGALREVHADDDWQQAVQSYIDRSTLVVMTVDRTENVVWEMGQILARGAPHKAVFVFPPAADDERGLRERVLSAVLGFPADAFAAVRASGKDVLAAIAPAGRRRTLIVADTSDDVSYEQALATAADLLTGPGPAVAWSAAPNIPPAGDLPLVRRQRGWRPAKPWYRRWPAVVWCAVLLLGLLQRTLDRVPGATTAPRPPVPGQVLVSHASPVAIGQTAGGLAVLDIARPALILTAAGATDHTLVPLPATPNGFLVRDPVVYLTFAQTHRLSAYPVGGTSRSPLWSTDLQEITEGIAATADEVFVALPGSNRVAVLDARTGRRLRSMPTGRAPNGLALSGQHLLVTNANDGTLTDVDLRRPAATTTVPVGAGPRSLAVAGGRIVVDDMIRRRVAVLDARTMRVVRSIPVPGLWDTVAASESVVATVSSQDRGWPQIAFVDLRTGRTVRTVHLPDLPSDLRVEGRSLLAALPDSGVAVRIPLP